MSSSSGKIFNCFRWLFLLVIIGINTSSSQSLGRLCGSALPTTLDLICKNGFGRKTKKSIEPIDYYEDMESELPNLFELSEYFSKFPTNALTKTRRRRHGIVDECCKKPCTLAELRSYCL